MKLRTTILSLVSLTAWAVALASMASAKDQPSTLAPVPREGGWVNRHESFNKRVKEGNVDLIFIGDSITQGWEGAGKEAWAKHYGNRKAVNLGIGGDRTQHVLWRLDNGNIDGIQPKLAVLMIGTNNSNGMDNTAEEIGAGITAIVNKLREKLPQTKVLVLAVFPRGEKPNPQREKNAKASEIAAKLADNQNVFFLDIGNKFLTPDGTLPREIMPDLLHLSPKGYEIWAEAIEPNVAQLMGEK
jgi:beta-glucosidase